MGFGVRHFCLFEIQSNLNSLDVDSSFTMANSNACLILPKLKKTKFKEIFLFYHNIVCCVYSLELPHRGNSNEYTQYTIIVQKNEKISLNYLHLFPDLASWLTISGSNHSYLEQISMVPKMFEQSVWLQ